MKLVFNKTSTAPLLIFLLSKHVHDQLCIYLFKNNKMKRKKNVKKFKNPFKEPLNLTITPKTQYIFCAYWKKKIQMKRIQTIFHVSNPWCLFKRSKIHKGMIQKNQKAPYTLYPLTEFWINQSLLLLLQIILGRIYF